MKVSKQLHLSAPVRSQIQHKNHHGTIFLVAKLASVISEAVLFHPSLVMFRGSYQSEGVYRLLSPWQGLDLHSSQLAIVKFNIKTCYKSLPGCLFLWEICNFAKALHKPFYGYFF